MPTLVTGATGVIGSFVVRRLAEAGDPVIATSSRGRTELLGAAASRPGVTLERCDVRHTGRMRELIERHGVRRVVHLAALMPAACRDDPVAAVEVNVLAASGLYAAAAATRVERFVYASSKSAYGPELPPEHGPPEYRPISEDVPPRPVWIYDASKYAAEALLAAQARQGGPELTSLRFATIYGPGKGSRFGGASVLSALVEDALAGRPVRVERGGDQVDDVIWAGDAADGVVRAARHAGSLRGLYNIGTGVGISIRDFAARVAESVAGASIEVGPGLHYMGDEPTYGVLDVTRAREDLGFAPDPDPARGVRLFAEAVAGLE